MRFLKSSVLTLLVGFFVSNLYAQGAGIHRRISRTLPGLSGTAVMLLDSSTQTKVGGATFGGSVTASSFSAVNGYYNNVLVTTVASGLNTITSSSNTLWLSLDGSTPTKVGGLRIIGGLIVSSITLRESHGIDFDIVDHSLQISTNLAVGGSVLVDYDSVNSGDLANSLKFGAISTGEGISSKKTAGDNQYGLNFWTAYNNRMSITNTGNVGIGVVLPTMKFDVNGVVRSTSLIVSGADGIQATSINNYGGNLDLRSPNDFHIKWGDNAGAVYIGQNGGVQLIGSGVFVSSSVRITGAGGIKFSDGSIQTTASSGSGGTTVEETTHTIQLTQEGDVTYATSPLKAINGAWFYTGKATYTILSVLPFMGVTGSSSAIYQLVTSTTLYPQNIATPIAETFEISTATNRGQVVIPASPTINAYTFVLLRCIFGPTYPALTNGVPQDGGLWIKYKRSASLGD